MQVLLVGEEHLRVMFHVLPEDVTATSRSADDVSFREPVNWFIIIIWRRKLVRVRCNDRGTIRAGASGLHPRNCSVFLKIALTIFNVF